MARSATVFPDNAAIGLAHRTWACDSKFAGLATLIQRNARPYLEPACRPQARRLPKAPLRRLNVGPDTAAIAWANDIGPWV